MHIVKVIIKRQATKFSEKLTLRPFGTGKRGRLNRMFAKQRKLKALQKKGLANLSKVDLAIEFASREKPLIDIANYNYNKGKAKGVNTITAKQKRQYSAKPLI